MLVCAFQLMRIHAIIRFSHKQKVKPAETSRQPEQQQHFISNENCRIRVIATGECNQEAQRQALNSKVVNPWQENFHCHMGALQQRLPIATNQHTKTTKKTGQQAQQKLAIIASKTNLASKRKTSCRVKTDKPWKRHRHNHSKRTAKRSGMSRIARLRTIHSCANKEVIWPQWWQSSLVGAATTASDAQV